MVFLPAYTATSRLFVSPDPILAILNRIIFSLTLVAIALSVWCDWRGRKRSPGKLLYFPAASFQCPQGTGENSPRF